MRGLLCLFFLLFFLLPALAWALTIHLNGAPAEVETAFRQESQFLDPDLPQDVPALQQELRLRRDASTLQEILQSFGYFQAEVASGLNATDVTFTVTPGPRFTFAQPSLEAPELPGELRAQLTERLAPVSAPHPYFAGTVLDTEAALLAILRQNGHPRPLAERRVVAHHASRTVTVTWQLAPGAPRVFGNTTIDTPPALDPAYVERRLRWRPGEPYDVRTVDATRIRLLRTGLFSALQVEEDDTAPGEALPMRIRGQLAAPRTVRAGLWYFTDGGPGVEGGWEHRNFLGAGERFTTDLTLSQDRSQWETQLVFPDAAGVDRRLVLSGKALDETTKAYRTRSITVGSLLNMDLDNRLNVEGGLRYRLSRVDGTTRETHNLLSTPMQVTFSSVVDLLDPRQGVRLTFQVEPFTSLEDASRSFLLTSISGRMYLPLGPRLTLALRGRSAAITGVGRSRVPQDVRLYAGGPQSIRGFASQSAGPLDADDTPEGGLAAVDGSAELRWRLTDTWGLAAFVDGGGAFAQHTPDRLGDLFWGAGLGLRYATPIGPLLLDIAVPVVGRRDSDAPFQIYINFGQAF
ncbi:outer membrane protein assembly factor [Thermodesulfomicrobium sp. WS]|uniref:autotransporter assembly complex protein TamA n=1 Tax=Thermodesulfomicrobium sp. WS TaxID=3004129 RepID=UPI002492FB1A|nr:BamA/TamA family outer membrane protein [Thermodesulfomicrobium sp. WS]BDV01201.1 outer membrane protein assembly factor [Thermodesulfomicrobium sp. WS]